MIGPLQGEETARDESNEYRRNLTLFFLFLCYANKGRAVGGVERKDCVPVTVGVPPVSSGPFNLPEKSIPNCFGKPL